MRKLLLTLVVLALAVSAAPVQADEYVQGGFEASGRVNAGVAFQHWSSNLPATNAPAASGGNAGNGTIGSTFGVLGESAVGSAAGGAINGKSDQWGFFVESVELDLSAPLLSV